MMLLALTLAVTATPACNLSAQWGTRLPKKAEGAFEIRDDGGEALWGVLRADDTMLEDLASGAGRETPRRPIILHAADADCTRIEHYAAIVEAAANCAPDWCVVRYKTPSAPARTVP